MSCCLSVARGVLLLSCFLLPLSIVGHLICGQYLRFLGVIACEKALVFSW